jgi:rhodanese-related sulfurtransferase
MGLSVMLVMAFAATAAAQRTVGGEVAKNAAAYFAEFPADGNVIRPDMLFSKITGGEDVFIIDVRRPADYAKGHLKGAVNLSFFDRSVSDALEMIPNDKPVFVYCYTGQAAAQVTVLLNLAGKAAKSVQSGFDNGVSKTDGHAALLEQTANPLPDKAYPVADDDLKLAVKLYFMGKEARNNTEFANYNLSAATLKGFVDAKNPDYLIVSARRADDYAKGHIPTARNIPFGRGMETGLAALPKDKTIVVYCYTGQTAGQTMAVLRMMGYEAYSMSGGMNAWAKEGFETVAD